jgi:diguanylate cyclase (GGDEF)-like protein
MVRQALDRARSKAAVSPAAVSAAPAAVAAPPPAPARKRRELKLVDRRDTPIGVALVVGSVMIFHRPLQFLFDIAADLEGRYHLDLVPALTLFSVVFGFHQYRKHQEARFMGAVATEEARRANERAEEMGRLMALGRDLANALTLDALRPLLWEHLPSFGPMRDAWMLVRSAGQWETLLGDSARIDERIAVADSAASETSRQAQAEGIVLGDTVCYPMVVADVPLAVMGLPAAEMTSMTARRRMGAVTALVAIALKNAELYRQTQDKGVRDSLTGCFNRGYTMEAIDNELRRARRTHAPVSILIFDVDSFKHINDRHGHLAGDRVLVEVAQQMLRTVRSSDIKCRYGGDEFIVILPETDAAGAARVAENLRQAVSRIAMTAGDALVKVTISVGVGSSDGEDFSVATLLARADDALYEAKRAGRNRVGLPASLT